MLWLVSNFTASQTGQQIIAMHILPDISRSKGNQGMKYGQLKKHSMRIFSCKIHTKNELRRLDLNHFLYFRKAFYKVYDNVYKKYN